jgi:prophage antirepressor-like protein
MEMEIFKNDEFGEIRTVLKGGVVWFVGKDVADILDYKESHKAISRLVDNDDRTKHPVTDTLGRKQDTWLINEAGLYSLVLSSKLKSAKKFKKWVTSEVLPTIRKHGIYATDNVLENILNNPDYGIKLLEKLKEERQARLEAEHTNKILMHHKKLYTATEIAKELGLSSAKKLNDMLSRDRIQFKQNGTWILYSNYSDLGYVHIKQEVLDSGKIIYHRKWTQEGRKFLLEKYS